MSDRPTVPDDKVVWYECENGHLNPTHDINHAAEEGKRCVREDCGALLTKELVSAEKEEPDR